MTKVSNQIKEGLKKSIQVLFEESKDNWTSVMDRSIIAILSENGINKNWAFPFTETLRAQCGFIEFEGNRRGMRYRLSKELEHIPDFDIIVEQVILNYQNRLPKTDPSDLTPPRKKDNSPKAKAENTQIIKKRTHFDIDSVVYTMLDNRISKFEVVGVYKVGDKYNHDLRNRYDEICNGVPNSDLFETPERLSEHLIKQYYSKK